MVPRKPMTIVANIPPKSWMIMRFCAANRLAMSWRIETDSAAASLKPAPISLANAL